MEYQPAQRKRGVHGRRGKGSSSKGAVNGIGVARVAGAEVVVVDAPAAGEELEGKGLGGEVRVAFEGFKVGLADEGGGLQGFGAGAAIHFVETEGGVEIGRGFESLCKRDGGVHGEFRAAANGEVGSVGGVAEEDNVFVPPFFADDMDEVDPEGTVGEEFCAPKEVSEESLAVGDGIGFGGLAESRALPDIFGTFDDEGAGGAVKGVGVDLKEAVFCFFE